jgi:copper transport protein
MVRRAHVRLRRSLPAGSLPDRMRDGKAGLPAHGHLHCIIVMTAGFLRRVVGVLLALPVLLLLAALPASAHSQLESSTPAQGSQLDAAPSAVTLGFTEEVGLSSRSLQVLDPAGRRADAGGPEHPGGKGRVMRVALRPGLGRGSYTVSWRVVSVDGHPVSGTFAFGVGVPAGTVTLRQSVDPAVAALRTLMQLFSYVGAALLVGGSCFVFWLWPDGRRSLRLERLMIGAVVIAGMGSVGALLVQGPYVAGRSLGGLLDAGLFGETLSASYGRPLLLRVLAVALSVPVLGIWPRIPEGQDEGPGGVAAVGNAVLLAASFSLTGHAAEASPRLLAEAADAVHLLGAGVWMGGLAVLIFAFLPESDEAARAQVLPRWSRTAALTVTAMVITGTYQAWRETRSLGALTGTGYGRLLIAKLAVVALLLALGLFAYRSVAAAAARPDGLWRIVQGEAMLGIAVLSVTAFLVATPPAVTAYAPPFSASVPGRDVNGAAIKVVLDVAPTRVGAQTVRLQAYTDGGAIQPFVAATGALSRQGDSAGAVALTFARGTPGQAVANGVVVPWAGVWTLTVQIRTDATTDYAATTAYSVR